MSKSIVHRANRRQVAPGIYHWQKRDSEGKLVDYYDAMLKGKKGHEWITTSADFREAVIALQEEKRKRGLLNTSGTERNLDPRLVPTSQGKTYWIANWKSDLPDVNAALSGDSKFRKENPDIDKVYKELTDTDELTLAVLWANDVPLIPARDIHTIIKTPTAFTQWCAQRGFIDRSSKPNKLQHVLTAADAAFELARAGFPNTFDPKHPRKDPHWPLLQSHLRTLMPDWHCTSSSVDFDGVWRIHASCAYCGSTTDLTSFRRRACHYCGHISPQELANEGLKPVGNAEKIGIWDTPEGVVLSSQRPVNAFRVATVSKVNTTYVWEDLEPLVEVAPQATYVETYLVASAEYIAPIHKQEAKEESPEPQVEQEQRHEAEPDTDARGEAAAKRLADDMPL